MSLETPGVPVASASVGSRKVSTKPHDPNRFYCPFPGCKRSFAELWRLKVHYRAPPDVRGSGKERGHGAELAGCPKCGVDLKPGKHHVGCFGGRTTTRQARRRNAKVMAPGAVLCTVLGRHLVGQPRVENAWVSTLLHRMGTKTAALEPGELALVVCFLRLMLCMCLRSVVRVPW